LAARSDPPDYGKLIVYEFPKDKLRGGGPLRSFTGTRPDGELADGGHPPSTFAKSGANYAADLGRAFQDRSSCESCRLNPLVPPPGDTQALL